MYDRNEVEKKPPDAKKNGLSKKTRKRAAFKRGKRKAERSRGRNFLSADSNLNRGRKKKMSNYDGKKAKGLATSCQRGKDQKKGLSQADPTNDKRRKNPGLYREKKLG